MTHTILIGLVAYTAGLIIGLKLNKHRLECRTKELEAEYETKKQQYRRREDAEAARAWLYDIGE